VVESDETSCLAELDCVWETRVISIHSRHKVESCKVLRYYSGEQSSSTIWVCFDSKQSQLLFTCQERRCLINLREGSCEHMECEISSSPKTPLLLLRLCWPRSSLHTGGLNCDKNFWRRASLLHREIREEAFRRAENVEVKLVLRHLSDYGFYPWNSIIVSTISSNPLSEVSWDLLRVREAETVSHPRFYFKT